MLPSALSSASAPGSKDFSRLNGWPMRSPVNASPAPSRVSTHDSGPVWFAIPSLQETFTLYSLPVSPAHRLSSSRQCPISHVHQRRRAEPLPSVWSAHGCERESRSRTPVMKKIPVYVNPYDKVH